MSDLFKDICRIAYAGYMEPERLEAMLSTPKAPSVWAYEDYNEYLDEWTKWADKYDPQWRERVKASNDQNRTK